MVEPRKLGNLSGGFAMKVSFEKGEKNSADRSLNPFLSKSSFFWLFLTVLLVAAIAAGLAPLRKLGEFSSVDQFMQKYREKAAWAISVSYTRVLPNIYNGDAFPFGN